MRKQTHNLSNLPEYVKLIRCLLGPDPMLSDCKAPGARTCSWHGQFLQYHMMQAPCHAADYPYPWFTLSFLKAWWDAEHDSSCISEVKGKMRWKTRTSQWWNCLWYHLKERKQIQEARVQTLGIKMFQCISHFGLSPGHEELVFDGLQPDCNNSKVIKEQCAEVRVNRLGPRHLELYLPSLLIGWVSVSKF